MLAAALEKLPCSTIAIKCCNSLNFILSAHPSFLFLISINYILFIHFNYKYMSSKIKGRNNMLFIVDFHLREDVKMFLNVVLIVCDLRSHIGSFCGAMKKSSVIVLGLIRNHVYTM